MLDTVKLSYPLSHTGEGWRWIQNCHDRGWSATKNYGTKGPLWWAERKHDSGLRVVVKGIGSDAHLLWEGSVPKALGLGGVACPNDLRIWERYLRSVVGIRTLPGPAIRRLDLTSDHLDPGGDLRSAALGWNPHARSRYVQADYQSGQTVWQHNKTRGVRVYDKFEESGLAHFTGVTRIEYQIRGDWLSKLFLDRIYQDLDHSISRALSPVVSSLLARAPGTYPIAEL